MTVGKMIELLGSKAGVSNGKFHYGSAFGEPSGHADRVEAIRCFIPLSWISLLTFTQASNVDYCVFLVNSDTLVKHGFSYSGKDFLYSGFHFSS